MNSPNFFNDLLIRTKRIFPRSFGEIRMQAQDLLKEMCKGEKNKPKSVQMLTVERIFPCIAIYKAITMVTGKSDIAYDLIGEYYEDISLEQCKSVRNICRMPILYRLVPGFAARWIRKHFSTKCGFKMKVHKAHGKECHIDMLKCPYVNYCRIYECEELVTAFCSADDVIFRNMHPNVSWDRTRAIGRGDRYCDFIIQIDR